MGAGGLGWKDKERWVEPSSVDPVNALLGDPLGMAASELLGCGDDAVVRGAEGGDGGRGGGGVGVDGHGGEVDALALGPARDKGGGKAGMV